MIRNQSREDMWQDRKAKQHRDRESMIRTSSKQHIMLCNRGYIRNINSDIWILELTTFWWLVRIHGLIRERFQGAFLGP